MSTVSRLTISLLKDPLVVCAERAYGAHVHKLARALLACAALAALLAIGVRWMTSPTPPVQASAIPGVSVGADDFSLGALRPVDDLDDLEAQREQLFQECMRDAGFEYPPTPELGGRYATQYGNAAIGDDGSATTPRRIAVSLPDGSVTSDGVTWPPSNCRYKADVALGSDPYLLEALRYRMMLLRGTADEATVNDEDFASSFRSWAKCAGGADPYRLLEAVDPASASPDDPRPGRRVGTLERSCVDDEIRATVLRVRAAHHRQAALSSPEIVQAWAEMLDQQLARLNAGRAEPFR